jgi:Whirly transcription factor
MQAVARPAATILQSNRLLHSHMGQRSMRAPAFAVQAPSTEQGAYAQQAYARQPATDQETYFGTGYQVYKGSSAVQFKPICPSFTPHSGSANGYVLDRKGVMFLELATGSNRQYDWQNRVSFALSATEMSSLFLVNGALTADGGKGIQLYHDPNMGSNEQGQVSTCMLACKLWNAPS